MVLFSALLFSSRLLEEFLSVSRVVVVVRVPLISPPVEPPEWAVEVSFLHPLVVLVLTWFRNIYEAELESSSSFSSPWFFFPLLGDKGKHSFFFVFEACGWSDSWTRSARKSGVGFDCDRTYTSSFEFYSSRSLLVFVFEGDIWVILVVIICV